MITEKAMAEVASVWARKKNHGHTKKQSDFRKKGRKKKKQTGMYMHFEFQSMER